MYNQVEEEKRARRKVIIFTTISALIILSLIVAIVVVAVNNANPHKTADKGNTTAIDVASEDVDSEAEKKSESTNTTTGTASNGSTSTSTTNATPTTEISSKKPAETSASMPSTGPSDILPLIILCGAATLYIYSRSWVKNKN